MREFVFNDVGVCINPNLAITIRKGFNYIDVMTAKTDNGWIFGLNIMCTDRGIGFGCSKYNKTYNTEDAAVSEGLKKARSFLQDALAEKNLDTSVGRTARQLLKEAEQAIPRYCYRQLDMFSL